MSVTNKIFGMWELAVADVYIRNGSGTNVGAQTLVRIQFYLSRASGKCVNVKTGYVHFFHSFISYYPLANEVAKGYSNTTVLGFQILLRTKYVQSLVKIH
jgi:hypothetical protein